MRAEIQISITINFKYDADDNRSDHGSEQRLVESREQHVDVGRGRWRVVVEHAAGETDQAANREQRPV